MSTDLQIVYDTPIEKLSAMLPSFTADQRVAAKERLRTHGAEMNEAVRDEWLKKQRPSNMQQPMKVRIRVSDSGDARYSAWCILNRNVPGYRHILPGEVVIVDMADPMIRRSFAKRIIELTDEAPTRPIVYETAMQAQAARQIMRVRPSRSQIPEAHVANAEQEIFEFMRDLIDEYRSVEKDAPAKKAPSEMPPAVALQLQALEVERETAAEAPPKRRRG